MIFVFNRLFYESQIFKSTNNLARSGKRAKAATIVQIWQKSAYCRHQQRRLQSKTTQQKVRIATMSLAIIAVAANQNRE